MTDPKQLPLEWFKHLQLVKLSTKKNVAKDHWLDMGYYDLHQYIVDELNELADAMIEGNAANIIDECVDVANFAAMAAHKAHKEAGGSCVLVAICESCSSVIYDVKPACECPECNFTLPFARIDLSEDTN